MSASPDTEPAQSPVLLRMDGAVARLTLNRPDQLNTIDVAMAEGFAAACRTIRDDRTVRAVVIDGAGRAFGGGGDLTAFREEAGVAAVAIIEPMHEGIRILTALDAPVVASLHGVVAGGSLSLALACDLAIAADGTRFSLAYVNIGASCDVSGSYHLPRLVGLRHALGIALLGETFDAAEALRLGLLNKVVPAERLTEETDAVVQRLAHGPTLAIGRLKKLLRASLSNGLDRQLDLERDAFVEGTATSDFREGIDAFFARRRPLFSGR